MAMTSTPFGYRGSNAEERAGAVLSRHLQERRRLVDVERRNPQGLGLRHLHQFGRVDGDALPAPRVGQSGTKDRMRNGVLSPGAMLEFVLRQPWLNGLGVNCSRRACRTPAPDTNRSCGGTPAACLAAMSHGWLQTSPEIAARRSA